MRQKLVISVSGKGGVGKTTITTLLVKTLLRHTKHSLLVVDADPVMNLPGMLGIHVVKTVGDAATQLRKSIDAGSLPPNASKRDILEGEVQGAVVEGDRFDFLAMGRTEGEGCYCYVNNILTHILDTLTSNYDITLLDMSAGLEHFSRRTDRNVDVLLIVIDPSRMAFEAAVRIRDLAREVHIAFKQIWVVANRFPASFIKQGADDLRRRLDEAGLQLVGIVPADDRLAEFNLQGKPLLELPDSHPSAQAVATIAKQVGLLGDETLLELLKRPASSPKT
jgi:CO dehydrogenase maturation factor